MLSCPLSMVTDNGIVPCSLNAILETCSKHLHSAQYNLSAHLSSTVIELKIQPYCPHTCGGRGNLQGIDFLQHRIDLIFFHAFLLGSQRGCSQQRTWTTSVIAFENVRINSIQILLPIQYSDNEDQYDFFSSGCVSLYSSSSASSHGVIHDRHQPVLVYEAGATQERTLTQSKR